MSPLVIQTTGLEQYVAGGEARLKLLVIGGPGVGKTRFASFFPHPVYADCEAGLASVADRRVPFSRIETSTDMLDLLAYLKQECQQPRGQRTYDTVVIDTLDTYQRKLKAEWVDRERKEAFSGWEAWGFVAQKMQLLLTRLLNLDMNVIVNVHFKDRTTKDDDTGRETHELMLQLQGEVADTVFNDFDLVGWMGTYWEAVGGQRIQKRGLTFKPSPDKPFLKDRLAVTPNWSEVTFSDLDYLNLLARVSAKLDGLKPSETICEVPSADPVDMTTVRRPQEATSGALPVQPVAELPLAQLDKPTLLARVRQLGITSLPDGSQIKGNTIKSELIAAIEHHLNGPATPAPTEPAAEPAVANPARVQVPAQSQPPAVEQVAEGLVNTKTGELIEPTVEQAVASVAQALGGTVTEERSEPEPPAAPEPAVAPAADGPVCEDCGKSLAEEDQNYVKLAWIKYRKRLDADCYQKRKVG